MFAVAKLDRYDLYSLQNPTGVVATYQADELGLDMKRKIGFIDTREVTYVVIPRINIKPLVAEIFNSASSTNPAGQDYMLNVDLELDLKI